MAAVAGGHEPMVELPVAVRRRSGAARPVPDNLAAVTAAFTTVGVIFLDGWVAIS
jgi:hypothetical protein